jgi:3'-phosphoadenosine 5'-phosphosulfate sulfotransferase (PAPS reductase)/FAD synthetase
MLNEEQRGKMKHILSLNGGKDSTIALWLILENNLPLDGVVCAVLPFEEKEMYDHLNKLNDYLKSKKGFGITFVKNDKDIETFMSEKTKRGIHKGTIRGFPLAYVGFCWISRDWKIRILEKYIKTQGKIIQYLGFATDEKNPSRKIKIKSYLENKELFIKTNNVSYPLVDFNYTEEMCRSQLKLNGLGTPLLFEENRTGCWFCPKASIESRIRAIKRDLINRIKQLEHYNKLSGREIYPDITIEELKQRVHKLC